MMRILALDIATVTGYACTDGSSGSATFALKRGDSPGMRYLYFREWLAGWHGLDLVVYEQPGLLRSGAAVHIIHGLISVAEEWAAERGMEITSYGPSEIKKYALPDVKASRRNKAKMMQAAENRWPDVVLADDNHADALWLLELTRERLGV